MWFHASTTRSHKIEVDLFGNDIWYIFFSYNLWPKYKVGEKGGNFQNEYTLRWYHAIQTYCSMWIDSQHISVN
jgi:hypothetical protein